jgi:hypothetical protein
MPTPRPTSLHSSAIRLLLILGALGCALLGTVPAAAADGSTDAQVKAAFVYNFAKFTEWPASAFTSPQAPVRLCLSSIDETQAKAFAGIEGKPVQGREVRIKRNPTPAEIGECHILYAGDEEPRRAQAALQAARNASVLTVSDSDGFADSGGVIGLVYADNRIQFDVNLGAAQRAGLKIASQVLKIARVVKDNKS